MSYKLSLRKLGTPDYLRLGKIFGARRFYCQNKPYAQKE